MNVSHEQQGWTALDHACAYGHDHLDIIDILTEDKIRAMPDGAQIQRRSLRICSMQFPEFITKKFDW